MLLNNQRVKEEIKQKYLRQTCGKATFQNLCNTAEAVLRQKFRAKQEFRAKQDPSGNKEKIK